MEYQAEESVNAAVKGTWEIERVIAKHISDEVAQRTEARVNRYKQGMEILQKDLAATKTELESMKHCYNVLEAERARVEKLVADMHAAALGEARGPIRGAVEDVKDLRAERDNLRKQRDELRSLVQTLIEKSAKKIEKGLRPSMAQVAAADEMTGCIAGTQRPLKTQEDRIIDLERTLREIEERASKPTPFDVFGTLESIRWLARQRLLPMLDRDFIDHAKGER